MMVNRHSSTLLVAWNLGKLGFHLPIFTFGKQGAEKEVGLDETQSYQLHAWIHHLRMAQFQVLSKAPSSFQRNGEASGNQSCPVPQRVTVFKCRANYCALESEDIDE